MMWTTKILNVVYKEWKAGKDDREISRTLRYHYHFDVTHEVLKKKRLAMGWKAREARRARPTKAQSVDAQPVINKILRKPWNECWKYAGELQ